MSEPCAKTQPIRVNLNILTHIFWNNLNQIYTNFHFKLCSSHLAYKIYLELKMRQMQYIKIKRKYSAHKYKFKFQIGMGFLHHAEEKV